MRGAALPMVWAGSGGRIWGPRRIGPILGDVQGQGRRLGSNTIRQMSDRVAGLIEQRLGIRGQGLPEKLRRGGRHLPRRVRRAAQNLAQADQTAMNPRLAIRLDAASLARDYETCMKYLRPLNRRARVMTWITGLAARLALACLLLGVLVLAVMYQRGQL